MVYSSNFYYSSSSKQNIINKKNQLINKISGRVKIFKTNLKNKQNFKIRVFLTQKYIFSKIIIVKIKYSIYFRIKLNRKSVTINIIFLTN